MSTETIYISLNGESYVTQPMNLSDLLSLCKAVPPYAIAVNGEFVANQTMTTSQLHQAIKSILSLLSLEVNDGND